MKNTVTERANEFLEKLNDEQLEELVGSNGLEWFPDDHIMRNFVNYAYQDIKVGFVLGMSALYPFIAKECYKRYINLKNPKNKEIKWKIKFSEQNKCVL